jgi:hypothetical protein
MTPLCRHVAVMSPLCRHVAMSPVCRAFPPSTSPSGEGNVKNLDLYFRYAAAYRHVLELTPHGGIESVSDRLRKQEWSEPAVDLLLHDRTMPDPVAFKHIAMSLNRIFRVRSGVGDESAGLRDYNAKDCANKWKSMFPTSQDAVATNNFLHHLREVMPGLKFLVEKIRSGAEINIGAIHIAWPWAKTCMEALQNSVFLDATFKITCYGYKLVFITTLDGNKQHRPLQTSFILYGHAELASFGDMKIVNWRHGGKIMRDRSTIGDMAGMEKELNAGHEPFSQKKKKQGRGGFARPGQGQKKNKVLAT